MEIVEVRLDEAFTCPICSQRDATNRVSVVRCVRCRTPHHHECFVFNKRCAIFACNSEHYQHQPQDDLIQQEMRMIKIRGKEFTQNFFSLIKRIF